MKDGMSVRLALVTVLLAASTAYVASATTLLPFYGRAVMDVELVCRNSTAAAPTMYTSSMVSAFRYTMEYTAASVYPFTVEQIKNTDYVRSYYISANERYVISDVDWCQGSTATNLEDPEVQLAAALRTILHKPLPSTSTTGTTRGISVKNYTNQMSVLIPAAYGGLDANVAYNAVVLTSVSGWTVNLMHGIDQTILSVELTSSSSSDPINNCLFTFSYYGANVSASLSTSAPSECTSTSSIQQQQRPQPLSAARVAATFDRAADELADSSSAATSTSSTTTSTTTTTTTTTAAPNTNTLYAMPEFPPQFTANFFVISPSQKSIYQVREAFAPNYGTSRAQLEFPSTGAAGRVYDYEWFVDGYNQMTYYQETFAVPSGQETIDKRVRQYFWPDTDTCLKVLVGYDIMASSSETLLLASANTPATFIGNETVRNIPCGVWTADVGGARVTWYWATPGMSNMDSFATDSSNNAETTYGTLVRMTVSGKGGASPFFTHHPFFPQGYSFPASDRMTACSKLEPTNTDMSCDGWSSQQTFSYIYDIMSFTPYVRNDDMYMSSTCSSASLSGSIPSFGYSYSGVGGAVVAVLLVIVAVLFGVMGGSCVWCRYSRMVRRQQEELVRLTQELQNPSSPAGQFGAAPPAGDANAWSSGAPNMKPVS